MAEEKFVKQKSKIFENSKTKQYSKTNAFYSYNYFGE